MRNTKLGNIFLLLRNGASIKQYDNASGFPITRIETIANKEVDRQKLGYANIFDCNKYKDYILNDNDILMSHINSEKHLGKVAIYKRENDETIIHGMNLLLLRPNCKLIVPKYIYYYFDSKCFKNQIVKITKKSVNQASFTVTALKDLEITIPSLSEQQRIANELDKVSELIDKRQTQLQRLDLLIKSKFVEMFGDPNGQEKRFIKVTLTNVCTFIDGDRGKNYPKQEEFKKSGYCLFLNAKNVTSDGFSFKECYFISREKDDILKKGRLTKGDIVLTTRGTIGNLAFYDETIPYENIRINSGMLIIQIDKTKLNEKFFINQFKFLLEKIKRENVSGSAQPQLPVFTMKKIFILLPPLELQNLFADFVDKVEKNKTKIKASLDKLNTLKKALMQKYFG